MMTRKDSKGRNLKTGESQRPDGRYMYRYTDTLSGKRIAVYDKNLAGLREKEREIICAAERRLQADPVAKKTTLNELFDRYLKTRELRERTRSSYISMYDGRIRNVIGNIRVVQIKPSSIRAFYSGLSKDGLSHNTIKYIHGLLWPCLELAVDDGLINRNPAKDALGRYGKPAKVKEALTAEQQEKLLEFVSSNALYMPHLPMIQVMLGACLRCGEVIGLTWPDVDMDSRRLRICGQLTYYDDGNGYKLHESTTKTLAGMRELPMTQAVYDAFVMQKELDRLLGRKSAAEYGERKNFVFCTKNGNPYLPSGVNSFLRNIVNAYNGHETIMAEREDRKPELMPPISAHTLRHSGCTRPGESGVNPKVMQYIMGHNSVSITMDVYNHIAGQRRVEEEMRKLEESARIGQRLV